MYYGLVKTDTGELIERMHSVNATNYGEALILMARQMRHIFKDVVLLLMSEDPCQYLRINSSN